MSTTCPNWSMPWLPGYSTSTPSTALSRAQEKLAASDSRGPASVVPSSANAYALACDCGGGLGGTGFWLNGLRPGSAKPMGLGDAGGRLGATSWTASDTPPHHVPRCANVASGRVRPPPVPLETP